MTRAAKKLLEEFDSLSDADRTEVVAEVLRRLAFSPHGLPDDGDLTAAADQVFLNRIEEQHDLKEGFARHCFRPLATR